MKTLVLVCMLCIIFAGCDFIPPIPTERHDYSNLYTGRDLRRIQKREDRFPIHGGHRVDTNFDGKISSKERRDFEERWRRDVKNR